MNTFWGAIANIPAAFWSAATAAAIAFGGVLLSNRNSRRQLRMQLDHAATRADRDREMTLRRDVYLPAAESMALAGSTIASISNLQIEDFEIASKMSEYLAAIAKVQVVANEAAVVAVNELQVAFTESMAALLPVRAKARASQIEIDGFQKLLDEQRAEQAQVLHLMKQANLQDSDEHVFRLLSDRAAVAKNLIGDFSADREKLIQLQATQMLELLEKLLERTAATARLLPDALLAVRKDLALPINEDRFRATYEDSTARQEAAAHDMISRFRLQVEAGAAEADAASSVK